MLLVHNGISHQQQKPTQTETQEESILEERELPAIAPTNSQPLEKVPESLKKTKNTESLTIEKANNVTESQTATLKLGLGESVFVLLIASPFLLLGLKRWLHK